MWEKNVHQRVLIIVGVILVALLFLRNPRQTLRGGLDIEGGFELIFEIEEEPGVDNTRLADDMKRLLQKRVDPKGVYDIKWRVLGRNRLAVQMPLPPKDNAQKSKAFETARDKLLEHNIRESDIDRLVSLGAAQRETEMARLSGGDDKRAEKLKEVLAAYDKFAEALQAKLAEQERLATSQSATRPAKSALAQAAVDADGAFESRKEELFAMNIDRQMLQDLLAMDAGKRRDERIAEFKARFQRPGQAEGQENATQAAITDAVTKYNAWRGQRLYLEGPADLRRLLRGAGVLEFRMLAEADQSLAADYAFAREQLAKRGSKTTLPDYRWFPIDNPTAFLNLDSPTQLEKFNPLDPRLPYIVDKGPDDRWYVLSKKSAEFGLLNPKKTGGKPWRLTRVYLTRDQLGRNAVGFELDAVGGDLFGKLTGANVDKQMCILVDDVAYSSANIQTRILSRGQITGDFTRDKVNYLVQTMQAGSLPAKLKDTPLSERTIGSSLGEQNLKRTFTAGVWGVVVVGVIMAGYYWVSGAIANVALILNILLVLAAMAMLAARFTLAGIAGVILTIGMTVDANVLIFERMREEKERGSSLRMIIKNGYDKALSTILDANITTLLTCVIIYYVGSEEIKGFGLTLGWGIVTSLFTALFVTRTIFTLLIKYHRIKDIGMLRLIGVPNIDWYGKRKIFLPLSALTMLVGLGLLYDRGRDTLDIEFRGGVNVEFAIKPEAAARHDDVTLRKEIERIGTELAADGAKLADASVTPMGESGSYAVTVGDLSAARIAAMISEPLESQRPKSLIQRGGVTIVDDKVVVEAQLDTSVEQLTAAIRALGGDGPDDIPAEARDLAQPRIGRVLDVEAGNVGRFWDLTTTANNKALVQHALVSAMGNDLETRPKVGHRFVGDADAQPFPITERRLEAVLPENLVAGATADLTDFYGGALLYFGELDPPQNINPDTPGSLAERMRNKRLQPDFADMPWYRTEIFGVEPSGGTAPDGSPLYRSIAVVVADDSTENPVSFDDDRESWLTSLALPTKHLVEATMNSEQTLRKVMQFKPQIAAQSQSRAVMALLFSWVMIIGYMWVRFGRPIYGMAGVAALIHDVLIALSFVGISGWIGGLGHPIGEALLIDDFKINMTIVAAFLTIIGYSINDTIVVFDRIRETRGRLGIVTPEIINRSINQCLSRTIMTSVTTLIVLLTMYIFGGGAIRGFNFCMIIGVITGTYSSIAVASPLLLIRNVRHASRAGVPAVAGA